MIKAVIQAKVCHRCFGVQGKSEPTLTVEHIHLQVVSMFAGISNLLGSLLL